VINAASIGRETAHTIFVTYAANWIFRPLRLGTDVLFSAIGLIATVEIWSRWKNEIFNPYRPELHYMRGPGPKWREKHAQAESA
jgi:hypothetical protein